MKQQKDSGVSTSNLLKKRSIAVVVPAFDAGGGVPAVAEFICRAIRRRPGFDLKVISLATSSRDSCSVLLSNPATWRRGIQTRAGIFHDETFLHVGACISEFEFQRFSKRERLSQLLQQFDLIQVVAGAPAWAWPVLGLGKPVALTVATLTAVERRMQAQTGRGALALWRAAMTKVSSRFDDAALCKVDAVMVLNPWMEDYVKAVVRNRPTIVRYAPPGVNAKIFHPGPENIRRAHDPYILAVGRFSDPRKNIVLLLEAFAHVLSLIDIDLTLILAGLEDPGRVFWKRADALGVRHRVTFQFSPSEKSLAHLYRAAFCLVLPSDEEGFGMVVIEAMASGLPVVATRCGGPDGIITDGVDGYLVDRGNRNQMADRIALLINGSAARKHMGERARATVEMRYADEVAGNAFLEIYDQLLEKVYGGPG
jgi:D-inositol-3-phosphate glycosyltransferase